MIREFVVPYYKKIAESFKCKIEIHFCSVSKPIGEQVLKAFIDCEEVIGISLQLGTGLYAKYLESIRNKLSIEAGYGDGIRYYVEKYVSFRKWAQNIKENFGGDSGLILYTTAGSLDEGKRLWEEWNEVWEGN